MEQERERETSKKAKRKPKPKKASVLLRQGAVKVERMMGIARSEATE